MSIIVKSGVPGKLPTASQLEYGQLALNYADEILYFKNSSNQIVPVGSGTGDGGTVTNVSGTGTVSGITLTGSVSTSGSLTLGGTLSIAPADFGSQTQKTFLAAPNATNGTPTFRTISASDIPVLNQNTTGNAGTVTSGVYTTGSYADPAWITSINYSKLTGTIPTWNQNTTGSAATLTTGRTISLSGDVTYTSPSFNGSANVTAAATLASVGTAGTYTKVTTDAKGRVTSGTTLVASDIPALDASKITTGTIDAARLPSYVDDVIEAANLASLPVTGETGKIYVALDTNKTYRWSGSAYVYITSGAVDSVAGKTGIVTLVKGDVGLGNVDNTSDATKPVSTAQLAALNAKVDDFITLSNGVDLNTVVTSGFYRIEATPVNGPAGSNYCQMLVCRGGDTIFQMVVTYSDNKTFTRAGNPPSIGGGGGGAWTSWRELVGTDGLTKTAVGLANVPNVDATNATNIGSGTLGDARLPSRLGLVAKSITDWNSATSNGWYMGADILNAPEAGWFIGMVQTHIDNLWCTQTVHAFSSDSNVDTKTWRREQNNGTWTSWYRLRISQEEQAALWAPKNNPAFTGQVIVPEGTSSVPGLAFANDGAPDTGFYHISDGVFGATANTIPVATFQTAGVELLQTPKAPTAAPGTNTTQLATTAFVNAEIANDAAPISHVGGGGGAHALASSGSHGFMSNVDKAKLDGLNSSSANAINTIVARDGSGNFSAGTITATLSGNATNVTGTVAIANGGTGATTAANARTNLGAQAALVSGTNIKTINSASLLGPGNIVISASAVSETISIISTNTTASRYTTYACIAPLTLTLPASPAAGDWLQVSNRSTATTIVVGRNAQNIMGLAEDMTVNVLNASVRLVFADATRGWIII